MKRMMIRAALLFFAVLSLTAWGGAGAMEEGGWAYRKSDDASLGEMAVIEKYRVTLDTPEILTVPETLGGCPVRVMESHCFDYSGETTTAPRILILPEGIRRIEPHALDAYDLEEIRIENGMVYETVDGVLFQREQHALAAYPMGKKDLSYTIPEGTEVIGEGSFYFVDHLEELHVPDSVRLIEEDAFCDSSYSDLTIYLPETVGTISPGAFSLADSGIRVISASPRYQAADNMLIDVQEKTLITIFCESPSESDQKSRTIVIPEGVETIGKKALDSLSCYRIVFPSTLKAIAGDDYFFIDSDVLEFPEGLKSIGDNFRVNEVKNIVFSEGLERIGDGFKATEIKNILFPSTLRSVGEFCLFNGNLESISFHEGIESIGAHAFSSNENLRTVYLPGSVHTIGDWSFRDCPKLQILGFPDTKAEEFCKREKIPFQYAFIGQWQAEDGEAAGTLNLPGAENVKFGITSDAMELTYTRNGSEQRESYPIEWKNGRLCMEGGYMNCIIPDTNQMILEMNGARLHLTRMEETE